MPRQPRETRESTGRRVNARKPALDQHRSQLDLPEHLIPPDMDYAWVAIAVLGQPHPSGNWEIKYRKGWHPVPQSRHADYFPAMPNLGITSTPQHEYIERGGLILCERPKADVRREREVAAAKALAAVQSLDNYRPDKGGDPSLFNGAPVKNDSSQVEFGRSVSEVKE